MKAEHRKELETNALAQQLTKAYEGLKQGPSRTTWFYIGGAVIVVLGIILFRYFMAESDRNAAERWVMLDEVVFPEQLTTLLDKSELKGSPQARLARFKEADLKLAAPAPGENRVVFMGDSITEGWHFEGPDGSFPGKPYINRGISGQTSPQMVLRFRQDVLKLFGKQQRIHHDPNVVQ